MRALRSDNLAWLSGGMALLVFVAGGEKVCPGLLTPPPVRAGDLAAAAGDAAAHPVIPLSPDDGSAPGADVPVKPAPLTWIVALPDAVPVRAPAAPTRASWDETVGARQGICARGPLSPPPANGWQTGATPAVPPWLCDRLPRPAPLTVRLDPDRLTIADPAVQLVLRTTGPPLG